MGQKFILSLTQLETIIDLARSGGLRFESNGSVLQEWDLTTEQILADFISEDKSKTTKDE